ncbi:MAG: nicotinate-nucleotide--dimethylbenzimidazole phosphoribosyltransferase [Mesorhizobium sp.]|uniref:nicotinate-nucleotide--dimethylbenzimidazole phosphoribosyltransferase n=1 Tax=Mesorhizobium sp. TaxID=1871066 RepID=UPI000FE30040|nr:nicotinate-nucleotide--dimethylbenzimidazole phosphoribosyltransferase [Mesorhizobium sp.]RWN60484.1 MAG: nicotinate-nucleotide--dimethylbenzimidazole phosphoribosyltransferase [Mesorhizobium sp.]RWO39873.1 MAG: nicotinate-nucleotide--dimethylbenzimidazole phosphoribosyltransferase [Mesorhizobium sp.]RWO79837.1 MAG: nicotinate-nucleotide--dimethylbenzimidazole phosphoribosyltransferase [Mesorhizobium sp.]TIN74575.1 MAG: nicotinate-nucleotide--dimethylbenzimidazole phosphoribosyltransferase [
MTSALPFDDFRNLLATLPRADTAAEARVRALFARVDKPKGSLGRIEDIAAWLAAWSGRAPPAVNRPLVAIFAGNHGVARHGISPRPVAATANAVELCAAGGAAINQICIANNLGLKVFDLALHIPTADITEDAALDERGCAATMAFGMEAIAGGADLLCLGDLGVGNSTVAAALLAALFGGSGADWVGSGSGADGSMRVRKAEVVDAALAFHGTSLRDPLDALRRVGGREFAAIAGAILAARTQKIPVLLDGLVATAAAAALHAADATALDHCLLASLSPEPAHARAAERLGLRPLLDLGVSHGEGAGAALAAGLVKAAALTASGMAAALH